MNDTQASAPLIVTGMHRSGTSATAGLLSSLSVDMGRDLLAADSHNVRGYFEDVEFLTFQRGVLSACCADDGGHPDWGWTEHETLDRSGFDAFVPEAQRLLATRADRRGVWGWKDPRTTLMLDFWDRLVAGARYVLVYRFPWDVADSMQRLGADVFLRHPDYGYRIWEYYNRHLRDFYRAHRDRCVLVSANTLAADVDGFRRALVEKLGLVVPGTAPVAFADELMKTTAAVDPLIDLVDAVWPECTSLLRELDELADVSGRAAWSARPVKSRLARPDAPDAGPIDVSVVTPCYNQGTLLLEAIASVERTAPERCELVIVNDGSSHPRTLAVLDKLKALGYYVHDQENRGLSAARNTAIAMARGRYILPLDDDNRLRAGFIRDAVAALDADPAVGVVYGDRYDFGLRNGTVTLPDMDLRRMLEVNYVDACAVYRREIWTQCGGYDAALSPLEDYDLWLAALRRGWKFHHLRYVTFDYRVRPGSLLAQIGDWRREYRPRIENKHAALYASVATEHAAELARLLAEQVRRLEALESETAALRAETSLLRERLARCESELGRVQAFWPWRVWMRFVRWRSAW